MRPLIVSAAMCALVAATSPASAVTFLDAPQGFDFGEVLHGESRQELFVFDVSHWNYVRYRPGSNYPGVVGEREYSTGGFFYIENDLFGDGIDFGIELAKVDCGAYSAPFTTCIGAKLISNNSGYNSAVVVWRDDEQHYDVFADGRERLYGWADHTSYSVFRYTPVPVPMPASWVLLISGIGLLGSFRKFRIRPTAGNICGLTDRLCSDEHRLVGLTKA